MRLPGNKKKKSFTLIELLVVVAIIAVLIALLLPVLNQTREISKVTICDSNLKQLGMAVNWYLQDNHDVFPTYWPQGGGYWCMYDPSRVPFYRYLYRDAVINDPLNRDNRRWVIFYCCVGDRRGGEERNLSEKCYFYNWKLNWNYPPSGWPWPSILTRIADPSKLAVILDLDNGGGGGYHGGWTTPVVCADWHVENHKGTSWNDAFEFYIGSGPTPPRGGQ